ncbi:LemA family protein [Aestuariimicrobium kwangyangense]|uniref:LemA family protein n=1 Tax=Aestuariimicrobium kwangyangense TaxID=396389 RepID=UPI00042369C5|nr:LemA family protein [Aestuariimicrobium kwangyangense]
MEWVILIVVVALIALALLLFVAPYNSFVRLRNTIQESWRQVDVELNRRYELIPNLVETVRAYAAHERNTLEEVTRLRNQAATLAHQGGGDVPSEQRAQLEGALSGAVRNLMVSVEAYPDLKSNQNFLELQRELTDTEDRIAAGRRFYNANVRAYNTKVEQVPSNIVANLFHFEKATYFEVNDQAVRQAPDVNFGEISYRAGDPQSQQTPALPQQTSQPTWDQQSPQQNQVPQQYQQPAQPQYQPPQYQQPGQNQQPAQPQQQPDQPQQGYQPPTYGQH